MRLRNCMVATLVLLVAGTWSQAQDAKKDLASMQGTWNIAKMQTNGKDAPDGILQEMTFVITKDEMKLSKKGENDSRSFQISLDANKDGTGKVTMKALNGNFAGKTNVGLYRVKGGKVTFCISNIPSDQPPTEFASTPGSNLALIELQKAKKE